MTASKYPSVLQRNLAAALATADLAQAAILLDRLKEEAPLAVETRGMELEFLLRSGKLSEAGGLAEQLLTLFPTSPRIRFLAGQVAYRLKAYGEAAEHFRESHRLRPHWRSQLHLAKSLTQLGEFPEATALFELLLPEHPECRLDLAWLYERQEQLDRALATVEAYLVDHPESQFAQNQRLRLRARIMDPGDLVEETQGLLDLGEEIADPIVPQYLEAMFRTGKMAEARAFVAEREGKLTMAATVSAAWVCYRFQAYDLAWALFLPAFDANRTNAKYLAGLEFSAGRCGRVAELIKLYESVLTKDPRFHGRLKRLRQRRDPPRA